MPADDLVGLIALEAPRARIPGGDVAVGIEHVDGVIGDRIDQQLESLGRDMGVETRSVSQFSDPAGMQPGGCRKSRPYPPRFALQPKKIFVARHLQPSWTIFPFARRAPDLASPANAPWTSSIRRPCRDAGDAVARPPVPDPDPRGLHDRSGGRLAGAHALRGARACGAPRRRSPAREAEAALRLCRPGLAGAAAGPAPGRGTAIPAGHAPAARRPEPGSRPGPPPFRRPPPVRPSSSDLQPSSFPSTDRICHASLASSGAARRLVMRLRPALRRLRPRTHDRRHRRQAGDIPPPRRNRGGTPRGDHRRPQRRGQPALPAEPAGPQAPSRRHPGAAGDPDLRRRRQRAQPHLCRRRAPLRPDRQQQPSASPRWGMVSPEEIERVDVLYGPFSAAYPGNSIGAVVNLTTRLPEEAKARVSQRGQRPALRPIRDPRHFRRLADGGDARRPKAGPLAWFVGANHLAGRGQPLNYVTVARPAATGAAGTPAIGAFPDVNRTGAPIFVIGAGGIEEKRQDNLKLKLALDSPGTALAYRGGLFLNDTDASAETYLAAPADRSRRARSTSTGAPSPSPPPLSRTTSIAGRAALDARVESRAGRAEASMARDRQPLRFRPGRAADPDRRAARRPDRRGRLDRPAGRHRLANVRPQRRRRGLSGGGHYDASSSRAAAKRPSTGAAAPPGALQQAARGRTRTSPWAEQRFALAMTSSSPRCPPRMVARLARLQLLAGAGPVGRAARAEARGPVAEGVAALAAGEGMERHPVGGQAYRFPTVSELYQAIATGPSITVPDPICARSGRARRSWPGRGRTGAARSDCRCSMRPSATP